MIPLRRKIRVSNHRNAIAYESRKSLLEQQGLVGMDSTIESLPPAVVPSESEWLAGGAFLSKEQNHGHESDENIRGTSLGSRTPTPPISESVRTDSISSEDSLSANPYGGIAVLDFAYEKRDGDIVPIALVEYMFEEDHENSQEYEGMRRASAHGGGRWGGCEELTEEPMALKLPMRGRKGRIEKEEGVVLKLQKRISMPVKMAEKMVEKRPHLARSDDTMRNTYQRRSEEVLGEAAAAGED